MIANPKRIEAIEALGARVNYDYEYVGKGEDRHRVELPDKIVSVHIPLTAVQWCAIAMREGGEYVGGCCGNMSAVQDEINGIFRDAGRAGSDALLRIGAYSRGHEGMEFFDEMDDATFDERLADVTSAAERTKDDPERMVDPWAIVGLVFSATEPALVPGWLDRPRVEKDDGERRAAIRVLTHTLHRLDWAHLFEDGPREDAEGKRLLGRASHAAARLLDLAKALQPTRDLLAYIEGLDETFEGFAIVEPGTEEVMSTYSGLCLYETREDAQWVLDIWARPREDEDPHRGKLEGEIVSVRVSVPDGLVVQRP